MDTKQDFSIKFPINPSIANLDFNVIFDLTIFVILLIYLLFSIIIIKQVSIMEKSLKTTASFYISIVAWTHLLFSLYVLIVSLKLFL